MNQSIQPPAFASSSRARVTALPSSTGRNAVWLRASVVPANVQFTENSATGSQGRAEHQLEPAPQVVQISSLRTTRLRIPLSALVQRDGDGYLAQTVDMPLYGYGEGAADAIESLRGQIESVYFELMEDDAFSDDWLNWKRLLSSIVVR